MDEPGHPLYVPEQGTARWDNPELYRAMYVAASPSGAIGETFAHLSRWTPTMLNSPSLPGAVRTLATYTIDEERHPLLDLDDARTMLDRGLRPTDVVIRDRPRTQRIAADVFAEGRWAGLSWWSLHRPQWTLFVIWEPEALAGEIEITALDRHPALLDAARLLGKEVAMDLST